MAVKEQMQSRIRIQKKGQPSQVPSLFGRFVLLLNKLCCPPKKKKRRRIQKKNVMIKIDLETVIGLFYFKSRKTNSFLSPHLTLKQITPTVGEVHIQHAGIMLGSEEPLEENKSCPQVAKV